MKFTVVFGQLIPGVAHFDPDIYICGIRIDFELVVLGSQPVSGVREGRGALTWEASLEPGGV